MTANLIAPNRSNPHDPECDCREAAAPVQGRLQGPPLPGIADPAGGLLVSALFLSYRDIEELFRERGLAVDHATLNRWVLVYAPLIERRLRSFRKPHCGSIRIDETYIKIRGQWRYLYRAIDKHGTAPSTCAVVVEAICAARAVRPDGYAQAATPVISAQI